MSNDDVLKDLEEEAGELVAGKEKERREQKQELNKLENRRMEERGMNMGPQMSVPPQENIKNAWERMLEPEFRGTDLAGYSDHFKAALTNVVPLAQIRRGDIPRYLAYFDCIWQELKLLGLNIPPHIYDSFRMVLELNLTRAVKGFERRMQQNVTQPEEYREKENKGFWDKLL